MDASQVPVSGQYPFLQPVAQIHAPNAKRDALPHRRKSLTQKVKIAGKQSVYYTFGFYDLERTRLGELFIDVARVGTDVREWVGNAARTISVSIQHGVPLEPLLNQYIGSRCQPCGEVSGHPFIIYCTSIMDLIARDMAVTFLHRVEFADHMCEDCMRVFRVATTQEV
jgi:hypothetical protein